MAVNPDQIWNTLDKIEQKLLSIVDDFDAVSQVAVALNGDIAKVLPIQLNASADAILELVNGGGQNSIKNLKDYVDNIPLGQLRTKSAVEAIRNGQAEAPSAGAAPTVAAANLAPRANSPQSAIMANESIDLNEYKKKKPLKERKLNENDEFSFDAILDDNDIDYEGYDSEIPEADEDYLDDDYSKEYDEFNLDEGDDEFDFDKFEDDRIEGMTAEDPTYEDAFNFNNEIFEDPEI